MVEGAPLLRAYRGKTPIEGSNPSLSANMLSKILRAKDQSPSAQASIHNLTHDPLEFAFSPFHGGENGSPLPCSGFT